jgi:hypothetical protein
MQWKSQKNNTSYCPFIRLHNAYGYGNTGHTIGTIKQIYNKNKLCNTDLTGSAQEPVGSPVVVHHHLGSPKIYNK